MMTKKKHQFHMVDQSPWPFLASIALMNLTTSIVLMFKTKQTSLMFLSISLLILISIQWWRDVIRESTFQGLHTKKVILNMKTGMILFIVSEIMFFMSFFWAFFHASLSPTIEMGMMWPPKMIQAFNPLTIPMLNTIILLSSGLSVSWSHNSIIKNNMKESNKAMLITIILGLYFSMLQGMEYINAPFTIADSMYGSSFFMLTGFHGIHVIVGTIFLTVTFLRMINNQLSPNHHTGFESAAWYWHFVDVVWIFLYIMVYWWGS